jgi:hypothetical protein
MPNGTTKRPSDKVDASENILEHDAGTTKVRVAFEIITDMVHPAHIREPERYQSRYHQMHSKHHYVVGTTARERNSRLPYACYDHGRHKEHPIVLRRAYVNIAHNGRVEHLGARCNPYV